MLFGGDFPPNCLGGKSEPILKQHTAVTHRDETKMYDNTIINVFITSE